MNPLYERIFTIIMFLLIGISFTYVIIQLFKKKGKSKLYNISAIMILLIFMLFLLFIFSHKTSFKYNDWVILESNISIIQKKYGKFDVGDVQDKKRGYAGYYIYTDRKHDYYYFMKYDEWGVIYEVYVSSRSDNNNIK